VQARSRRSAARGDAVTLRRVGLPLERVRSLLARFAPTRRSLTVGLGLLALAFGAYAIARETSLFAIHRIEVNGAPPRVAAQVRRSLASLLGTTLVGLDGSSVIRRVEALPTVVRASYDRAFPNTLRVRVVGEEPAAVLRSGPDSWLVSVRGRVMERLRPGAEASLPRVWVGARRPVRIGEELAPTAGGAAARAVGLSGAFAARVTSASYANGSLVFHLRSGFELLLGSVADIRLKVAVAQRALAVVPTGSTFLDVSVPGRPVAGSGTPGITPQQGSSRG
jgi:cell division protein FtsQ